MVTLQEKIDAVEAVIEDLRWARNADEGRLRRRHAALRAVAADLRARLAGAPTIVEVALEQRMRAVQRSKTMLGYGNGAMVGLAQELVARWPAVKQGLELLGREEMPK